MGLDEALKSISSFGRWQVIVYMLVGLSFGPPAMWQLFAIVFIGYINPHFCKADEGFTQDQWSPKELDDFGTLTYAQCKRFSEAGNNKSALTDCSKWKYVDDGFDENGGTIAMAWDLVCDKDTWVETSQTVFNVGVVSGFLIFTPLQDTFGRKRIFYFCALIMNLFGLSMSFAPNYYVFCVMQFLTGAAAAGLYMSGLVISTELFPSEFRNIMAPGSYLFFTIGTCTLSLWAHLFRHWRDLQFLISCIGFLSLLTFPLCPESMRFLIVNNRLDEVKDILRKGARWNKKVFKEELLDDEKEVLTLSESVKFKQMFTNPRPRRYVLIMIFLVFASNIAYYGLSLMTTSLSGDKYMNFFIVSLLEIPGTVVAIIAMTLIGRRYPLVFFNLFAAVFLILSSVFTTVKINGELNEDLMTSMALIAKFGISGAFTIELIYSLEIYPTSLRGTGTGITVGCGFMGSIMAPYSVYLYRKYPIVPGLVFAGVSFIAAFLSLLEPETLGRPLPNTIEEINAWTLTLSKEEKENAKEASRKFRALFSCKKNTAEVDVPTEADTPAVVDSTSGIENPAFEPNNNIYDNINGADNSKENDVTYI
ncbi:DgyrCDS12570 [Dimorphilus gyrociliatus]|uniref:DgyrCDS12570 n=1 Tax=Dimorphilus gyrociliatus TaxID=2664684 RepID=A0A7I8W856_9ANNE|nr:DgyrCDS12570 [Dimorphilus gyrociliatus]